MARSVVVALPLALALALTRSPLTQSLLSVDTLAAILGDAFSAWLTDNYYLYVTLSGVLPTLVLAMYAERPSSRPGPPAT